MYGTLQDERVIRAVTGKVFPASPAVLRGYRRYRVKDADYPGICPDVSGTVEGLLLDNVDDGAIQALDVFEGEYYERKTVDAVSEAGGVRPCFCYVIHADWLHLLSGEAWSLEEFQRVGYQRFRDTYPNF